MDKAEWLRHAEQHEAEAEGFLRQTDGQEPGSAFTDYLLRMATISAQLAHSAAQAAVAQRAEMPVRDLVSLAERLARHDSDADWRRIASPEPPVGAAVHIQTDGSDDLLSGRWVRLDSDRENRWRHDRTGFLFDWPFLDWTARRAGNSPLREIGDETNPED